MYDSKTALHTTTTLYVPYAYHIYSARVQGGHGTLHAAKGLSRLKQTMRRSPLRWGSGLRLSMTDVQKQAAQNIVCRKIAFSVHKAEYNRLFLHFTYILNQFFRKYG